VGIPPILTSIPYLFYFIGPFLIAALLKRHLQAGWGIFFIGFPLFILSQIGIGLIQGSIGSLAYFMDSAWTPFIVTFVGCLAAGLCEESCRVLGFKWLIRRRPVTAGRGIMYAIGHSGMETLIVGVGFFVALLVGTFATGLLEGDDGTAELLNQLLSLSPAWTISMAAHRLFFGLLIHSVFTLLVVRYMQHNTIGWLLAAMGLHALNNGVALSLQNQMGDPVFLSLYSLGLVVVYGTLLVVLWKRVSANT